MQKHIAKAAAKPAAGKPVSFVYTTAAYMFERRESGWYVARYVTSMSGEKPKWSGPFEIVESVCLSAPRHMAVEIADRHTRSVEAHKIAQGDPLYGLKPTTRLNGKK